MPVSTLVAGDLRRMGQWICFCQDTSPSGVNAVVMANVGRNIKEVNPLGPTSGGPGGLSGRPENANVLRRETSMANIEQRADLLVPGEAQFCHDRMYASCFQIPVIPPNMNGIVLAQGHRGQYFPGVGVQEECMITASIGGAPKQRHNRNRRCDQWL